MIIAFTGAGISKESGIDTFQDRPGIREKLTRDYADMFPLKFREVMTEFVETMDGKEPNDAHKVLAEYNVPIITMNVDDLHEKAGSKYIIKVHGRLPSVEELDFCDKLYGVPVLYGDSAPMYNRAYSLVNELGPNDILLVIGASTYTSFSYDIRVVAKNNGAEVIEIQDSAAIKVREYIEKHREFLVDNIERCQEFFNV